MIKNIIYLFLSILLLVYLGYYIFLKKYDDQFSEDCRIASILVEKKNVRSYLVSWVDSKIIQSGITKQDIDIFSLSYFSLHGVIKEFDNTVLDINKKTVNSWATSLITSSDWSAKFFEIKKKSENLPMKGIYGVVFAYNSRSGILIKMPSSQQYWANSIYKNNITTVSDRVSVICYK